ncbi:RNA-binding protein 7 isoform 2-T2 [Polymixia lowei]
MFVLDILFTAGPLIKTKIPKDGDGKQKTFGFAVYKHEDSVPYAMQLLDGTSLFGKTISVQFRSGSSHGSSPGNSQKSSPVNTPNPHGLRTQVHLNYPPHTPPQMQRSYSSPESLQKHVMMNNMWQIQMQQMQQLQQINGLFPGLQQRHQPGAGGGGGGSRQHDNSSSWQRSPQTNSGSSHHSRGQRNTDEPGSGRHQQHSHGRDNYHHHDDRSSNRHRDNRGGNRHHDDRGGNRGYQDGRWKRY